MRTAVVILVVGLVMAPAVAPATSVVDGDGKDSDVVEDATILSVYPNPPADGDRGEFITVRVPGGNWSVTDGETTVRVPGNGSRTVVLTAAPAVVRPLVDRPVRAVKSFSLANSGEKITLRNNGVAVVTVSYEDAPEGEQYVDGTFSPLGVTAFPVSETTGVTVTTFTLPDSPHVPLSVVRNASSRLYLAGYTLTSRGFADALIAAAARGVDVRVLLEGGPVGGITTRQARLLDRLVDAGVRVRLVTGDYARYDYHHAKYLVADDRAVVLSENFKPAGTGGHASRGWGTVVDDQRVASQLSSVFEGDAGWVAAKSWSRVRDGRQFEPTDPANGSFPSRTTPETVRARSVRVLVAPDNAESALRELISSAEDSILVQQVAIDSPHNPLLQAVLDAARRGVTVKIQLSSAWYVEEDNRRLADWLRDRAEQRALPLSVQLADPDRRFEKIHNKGVVVDHEHVVVGSINWNNHSLHENREVALVLTGDSVGQYYADVFASDWSTETDPQLPFGVVVAVAVAAAVAIWYGRRFEFEEAVERPPEYELQK